MAKEKILLFIPVYNCEKQIQRVLAQLDGEILSYLDQIIILNNLSSDKTEEVVIDYLKKHKNLQVQLLRNYENYGLGGSHKAAFYYAMTYGYEYVVVLHGDDQGDIKDLLPLLKSGKYHDYDCCLGARFKPGSVLKGYSQFRTFGNIVYNLLFSIVTGRVIYDLGAGINLYKVSMLENEFYFKYPDNLTFNYCMILGTISNKQKFLFFPITWREDDQVSNVKMFKQAFFVLGILVKYFFGRKKYLQNEFREIRYTEYLSKSIYDAKNVTNSKK